MTNMEKHDMVADDLLLHPNDADRAVASRLGVSPTFVGKVRRYLQDKGKLTKAETRQGQDGRKRKRRRTQNEMQQARKEMRRQELLEKLRWHNDILTSDRSWAPLQDRERTSIEGELVRIQAELVGLGD
jgi:hypothetical protein